MKRKVTSLTAFVSLVLFAGVPFVSPERVMGQEPSDPLGPISGINESDGSDSEEKENLRYFDPDATPYRTLRSGEGFRTRVFGMDVEVPARDRRSVRALDIGLGATAPGADEAEVLPFGSLYFWYHPDEDTLLRAIPLLIYNEFFFAKSPDGFGPFELVATFDSVTIPAPEAELIDGERLDSEELNWGFVRPGVGFGYRRQVSPGENDNMFAATVTFELGYSYFDDDDDTAPNYVEPQDTFVGRVHGQLRWDALVRNLLELPHEGYAMGADLVHGHRFNWENWGLNGAERAEEDRTFTYFTGYMLGVTGVPGLSERHRISASVHGMVGSDVDRFSSPRLGGGPHPYGEEYGATSRAVIPGATVTEFFPSYYAVITAAYRYEPIFFTYIGPRASVAFLDRDRRKSGRIKREDDVLGAVGFRLTTGFLWKSRLQLDYSYNWAVIRSRSYGGHEVVFHISFMF